MPPCSTFFGIPCHLFSSGRGALPPFSLSLSPKHLWNCMSWIQDLKNHWHRLRTFEYCNLKKKCWKLSLLFRQLFCLDVNIFNRGKDLRRFIQCNKCRSRLHIHYWQKGPGCILLFDHESPVKYFKFLILLQ